MSRLVTILLQQSTSVYLLEVSAAFTLVVIGILFFIAYYLQQKQKLAKTKKILRGIYSNLISEISFTYLLRKFSSRFDSP